MQTISLVLEKIATDLGAVNRLEQDPVPPMLKILTDQFSIKELNVVEDFLFQLGSDDLDLLASGEGQELADMYRRTGTDVEVRQLVEDMLNTAFDFVCNEYPEAI